MYAIRSYYELIRDRVESGQGAILLGAHFGSFEALRGLERELPSMAVHYLMFNAHAEASTELLASLNPEVAARVIPLSVITSYSIHYTKLYDRTSAHPCPAITRPSPIFHSIASQIIAAMSGPP